jgi:hypothetical protein
MADPEGNEFCLCVLSPTASNEDATAGNRQSWSGRPIDGLDGAETESGYAFNARSPFR